jgi:hypothetical protein
MIGNFADAKVRSGLPATELWGVSQRDRSKPRNRGDKARARRRAKRAARVAGVALKKFLRGRS